MGLKGAGANQMLRAGLLSATRYAAIYTGNGAGEQSGAGYARIAIPANGWAVAAATGIATINSARHFSPNPSAAWNDSTWGGLVDASTGGNILITGAHKNNPDAPQTGAQVGWANGELRVIPPSNLGTLTLDGWKECLQGGLLNATRYFSLHTQDPSTTRAGELSGGGYEAQSVILGDWTITAAGVATLTAAQSWAAFTADLPNITYLALCDSATGGKVLWRRQLTNARNPNQHDAPNLAANSVVIQFTVDA